MRLFQTWSLMCALFHWHLHLRIAGSYSFIILLRTEEREHWTAIFENQIISGCILICLLFQWMSLYECSHWGVSCWVCSIGRPSDTKQTIQAICQTQTYKLHYMCIRVDFQNSCFRAVRLSFLFFLVGSIWNACKRCEKNTKKSNFTTINRSWKLNGNKTKLVKPFRKLFTFEIETQPKSLHVTWDIHRNQIKRRNKIEK